MMVGCLAGQMGLWGFGVRLCMGHVDARNLKSSENYL